MTYAVAVSLQTAVFQQLVNDSDVQTLSSGNVFDAIPTGTPPSTYVSLGPEEAFDASDISGSGARHDFMVSVVTDTSGFQAAKTLAGAICDALISAELTMTRGSLVDLWFRRAKAVRTDGGNSRRIDLYFRARVQDS